MSVGYAASLVWARWEREAGAGAVRRPYSWSARVAPRSRRAPPAYRRRLLRCPARPGNLLPGIQDTTAWSIEMLVRTQTAQGPSRQLHHGALPCHTTQFASCRPCLHPHPCLQRSPGNP